jgi:DNA modification methylase
VRPYYQDNMLTLYNGDCREVLRELESESVDCVVTSPPYYGLRDYGVDGQIGLEQSPAEYVAQMVEVFREVRRVLKPPGTLWLNLGDSYANDGKWGGHTGGKHAAALHCSPIGRNKRYTGLKPKDLIGIPWRVALDLQADAWWLRSDIVWAKGNPMPESVTDRPTRAHEYVFLLTKSERYYYNADAIAEPIKQSSLARMDRGVSAEHKNIDGAPGQVPHSLHQPRTNVRFGGNKAEGYGSCAYSGNEWTPKEKANRRSVWNINTRPFSEAHFATMPEELARLCVLAGCPAGGVVLDPFAGAGTTLKVARDNNCKAIGIELNSDYCGLILKRMAQGVIEFTEVG